MLKRILLGILLSIGISACQSEKEKAYDDLMNDLDDMEDSDVYLTDHDACVEYLVYFAPILAKCKGSAVASGLEERAVAECTAMQCDNVNKNWSESLVDDCVEYYAVCGNPVGDPPWYSCEHSVMATCIDTDTDTVTE
jgi:hypothetical protein